MSDTIEDFPGGRSRTLGIQARGYSRPMIEAQEPYRPAVQA